MYCPQCKSSHNKKNGFRGGKQSYKCIRIVAADLVSVHAGKPFVLRHAANYVPLLRRPKGYRYARPEGSPLG